MNSAGALLLPVFFPLVTGDAFTNSILCRTTVMLGLPDFVANHLKYVYEFGSALAPEGMRTARFFRNADLDENAVLTLLPANQ